MEEATIRSEVIGDAHDPYEAILEPGIRSGSEKAQLR
jgi:hypothetical protein